MRYGIALPNYGSLAAPDNLVRLANHAEACGADSVWVSDHVIVPAESASIYPYDRRPQPTAANLDNLEQFYDALTTLAFIAGVTTRVRLGVSVYVVPLRNPLQTAKIVATLDALSNGRVIFGCGVGWLREEFEVLHAAPFEERGRVTDAYVTLCKSVWTGDVVQPSGPHYSAPAFRSRPTPVQRPHPPIWIGGNGRAALERTVRLGDGWHPIDLSPADISAGVHTLHGLCAAAGRDATEITVSLRHDIRFTSDRVEGDAFLVGTPETLRADIAAYAAAGVDCLVLNLRQGRSIAELLDLVDQVAPLFNQE